MKLIVSVFQSQTFRLVLHLILQLECRTPHSLNGNYGRVWPYSTQGARHNNKHCMCIIMLHAHGKDHGVVRVSMALWYVPRNNDVTENMIKLRFDFLLRQYTVLRYASLDLDIAPGSLLTQPVMALTTD